jgi:hypothetical protein
MNFQTTLSLAIIALLLSSAFAQGRRAPQPAAQRIAPPAALKCSRDHLTSFTGRILAYRRTPARLFLRVRTDEATTESFTIKLSKDEKAETYFLLRGEAFTQNDWQAIESSTGRLKQGMRATVWVCDDGSKPVIDWRPAEK